MSFRNMPLQFNVPSELDPDGHLLFPQATLRVRYFPANVSHPHARLLGVHGYGGPVSLDPRWWRVDIVPKSAAQDSVLLEVTFLGDAFTAALKGLNWATASKLTEAVQAQRNLYDVFLDQGRIALVIETQKNEDGYDPGQNQGCSQHRATLFLKLIATL